MKRVLRVAWFRFRATFGARFGGYVALVLLMALLGGIAMGSVAGARRNQAAYPAFLASTHPSDLSLPTGIYNPAIGFTTGYNSGGILTKIKHLPHVKHVESLIGINGGPLSAKGAMLPMPPNFDVGNNASVDGLNIDQDRVTIIRGRMLDPSRADEMVVSPTVAKVLAADGVALGSRSQFIVVGNNQSSDTPKQIFAHPARRLTLRLVGVGVQNNAVIQDDVDQPGSAFYLFGPALTRSLLKCCAADTVSGLVLDGGARDVRATEAELEAINPRLDQFSVAATDEAKTERAVKPESVAFGVFGLIAALATLLLAGQVIGRQLRSNGDDLDALRALGAGPAMTASDGLFGVIIAVAIGSVLAAAVAVGLSPVAPIGVVRRFYPYRGIAFDWTVLGAGVAVFVVALTVAAVVFAYRGMPHRVARRSALLRARRSSAARAASTARLPTSAVTGIRFALESGRGKNTVPVRSAILGAVLAIVVVVGTLTFGSSLRTLVSRPALYGWNWSYELAGGDGAGAVPQKTATELLRKDPDVAASTGVYFDTLQFDGVTEPVLAGTPNSSVQPPLLSGHGLAARDQVVLGASTLAQLHKRVGETITMSGAGKPTRLTIVGTATMPAVGSEGDPTHPTMGVGALLSSQVIPAGDLDQSGNTPPGPNAVFVRLKPGVNDKVALRNLKRIASQLSLPSNYGVSVMPVQRPAEIVNYRSMSNTPLYLGSGLAVGAVGALALTLIASVRRRRRELALLKTLGFTRRQLAAVVAWQSSVSVAIGVVVGVPLGIVVGRTLWRAFAHEIHAVPVATVPTLSVALVAVGALVLANVVAAIPGLQAARTPTAVLLHAE